MSITMVTLPPETIAHVKRLIRRKVNYNMLALGGGVQSGTLFLMNLLGLIKPRAEFAVFADTMDERGGTYEYLDFLDAEARKAGFPPIMRVSEGDIIEQTLSGKVDIPVYTDSNKGGKRGQLNRQCTGKFKIEVVKREVRKVFGMKQYSQWIGFSMDEITRRNDTIYPNYITPRYPLLEMRMTRDDCKAWLRDNGYPEPPKSSYNICPFRSDPEWADMKANHPEEFRKAAESDNAFRELVPPPKDTGQQLELFDKPAQKFHVFLHPSKQPLELVQFTKGKSEDQHGCGSVCAL